jgi:uncharacterized membrane protein (UPF0136 family)
VTKAINAFIIVFGLLCIGMGVQSAFFPREGVEASMKSLYAAGGIGVLFLASVLIWTKNPRVGRIMAAVLCLACLGRFVPAFLKTSDMYPAGVTALGALILFGMLIMGHLTASRDKASASE